MDRFGQRETSPVSMSEIRFEGVAKRFGSNEVVSGLDLLIREGELMMLVGPSGCAKSTTLRMIAGLESVSAGNLFIGGECANRLGPGERNIAMVFQSYALFPNMTVRGNLSFGMKTRGEKRDHISSEVDRVAAMLGLGDLLDRKPRQLSGGQAQRVALGRAMIRKPRVFLFDEPLSNLDADLRVQMRLEISRLQRELGTTTVYVTHDQVEAMTLGDRVAVMNAGRIMQVGIPLELYNNPANRFVAGFIGSPRMNLIELAADAAGRLVPEGIGKAAGEGCVLGVRPERVKVDSLPQDGKGLALRGLLLHMEALGHETLLQIAVESPPARIVARCPGDAALSFSQGDTLSLHVEPRHMLFFDRRSGERIE